MTTVHTQPPGQLVGDWQHQVLTEKAAQARGHGETHVQRAQPCKQQRHSSDNHRQCATPLLRNLNRSSVSSNVPSTQTKCRQVLMNGGTHGQNSNSITPRGRKGTRPLGRCPEKDFQGLDLLRIVSCCADKHVLGGVRKMQGSILQKLYLAAAQTKNGK